MAIETELTVLATIPARAGSKRLPGKNLRPLGGQPLIAYAIRAALACGAVDRVVVSTEDAAIAGVARDYGASVVARPAELATDEANLGPVCRHALAEIERIDGRRYEIHVLLQPTSPFRTARHIREGLDRLLEGGVDSVQSVRPAMEHPLWTLRLEDGLVRPYLSGNGSPAARRKQELPPAYYPNGALYIAFRRVLVERGEVLGERIAPLAMSTEASIDIDTPFDFLVAEALLGLGQPVT
jgi:CMP-N-acetylneuraminic acid synthetase